MSETTMDAPRAPLHERAWSGAKTAYAEWRAKRRSKEKPPAHGAAALAWCILLTAVGVTALAGSTWLLLVFIAGSVGHVDWAFSYRVTEAGVQENRWHYEASIHMLVAIGLALFCFAIAMFNATWLEVRKYLSGLIRNVVTTIGVFVAIFMICGAVVVQQRGTDARERDEVIAAQTAEVGASTAAARLARAETRLREMRNHENQYMAVAATVGAAEFERSYLSPEQRARETPERLRLLERSLGAARQADALETEIEALQSGVAAAQAQAVVAQAVSVRADGYMAQATVVLEDLRKPITAVLGELLAMTAFSFALAAWQSRHTRVGWADESRMVSDLRAEEPVVVDREAIQAEFVDAKRSEAAKRAAQTRKERARQRLREVDGTEYERGVEIDGGGRSGKWEEAKDDQEHAGVEAEHRDKEMENSQGGPSAFVGLAQAEHQDAQSDQNGAVDQPEPPTEPPSDEELRAYLEPPEDTPPEPEPPAPDAGVIALPANEGVMMEEQHDAHVIARERAMEAA